MDAPPTHMWRSGDPVGVLSPVNGFLLGRYWEVRPQVTLYLTPPLLRGGFNRITVLELEHLGPNWKCMTARTSARAVQYVHDLP